MKIGGITWWRNNYGSILQAYALQQYLNKQNNIQYEIINQYGKKILSYDNFWHKIKKIGLKETFKRAIWKIGFKPLRYRNFNLQNFIDKEMKISNKIYNEEIIFEANNIYDGFICGSDQIWNPYLVDDKEMYWLSFARKDKIKIAYAPSIGVDFLDKKQRQEIESYLLDFTAVSCRENTGTDLLNSIINRCCTTVLDPTLLVNKELWDNISKERIMEEEYVFAYFLRGTKEQRKIVEKFGKIHKLKVVSIPFVELEHKVWYDIKFGDERVWDAAPNDFVNLIRYAKYVFTDSFHSTVFSCIYHVPFFVFPKIGLAQMNRIVCLQEMLKIKSRVVNSYDDLECVFKEQINWENVENIVDGCRKKSQKYLKDALERKV